MRIDRGGTAVSGWEIAQRPVPAALRPFVDGWTGYREWSPDPVRRLEYPTGRASLVLELGSPLRVFDLCGEARARRGGFLAAIDDAAALTETAGAQEGVQVNLTPLGALALVRAPMREVARGVHALDLLAVPASLLDELASSSGWDARLDVVEAFLSRRFAGARPHSGVVAGALARIDAEGGAVRVGALCAELGHGRKHLHERFVAEVGLSPKRYAELRRFARVTRRLRGGSCPELGAVAAAFGYCDQAHLAREVRRLTGSTATALRRALQDPLARAVHAADR